ncbi:F-box-like protein [Rhizoctonia solani AG-3 Rhs1AP]|uniref:F-box-like protein n=1 Tax=Rhizoctonia solani AG-3 Rhs1AP TaxID=1086054 RepID=X8JB22_9AGAM|nr:F-box-like protein [Rhizoctonia solani AG-3 Rhs1AP]
MFSRSIPPTFSAIREWEIAGLSLSGALENYLDLSTNLGTKALRENIHPKHTIARIDSALQSLHTVLTQQLTIVHSTLARTRNQLASVVYYLPHEILSEIFMRAVYVCSPIGHDTSNTMSMKATLLDMFRNLCSLQSVCHLWRDIILSRGVFWHFVPAYCTDIPGLRCTEATDLALKRSNGDLHLAAVVKSHLPGEIRTLKTFSRFRKVNISAKTRAPISDLIRRVIEPGPPLILSELSLYEKADYHDPFRHNNVQVFSHTDACWNSFCQLISSLSILRVRGAHFAWNRMIFSHRLVELHIQDVKLGPDEAFVRFLKKLSLAPNLRDLKFVSIWSSFDLISLGLVRPEQTDPFPPAEIAFPSRPSIQHPFHYHGSHFPWSIPPNSVSDRKVHRPD